MSSKFKKVFLGCSIALPFFLYCIYYYAMMVKNAPYKFVEFNGIVLKAGIGHHYEKIYDSKTSFYQYKNTNDSTLKAKVKFTKDDLLYLHRKAVELGFWNWPNKMLGPDSLTSPRYYLEYRYQKKNKIIEIDGSYNSNDKLKQAALQLIKTVDQNISDAEDRKY
ncbi:MAG: hypothetical protein EAZ51_06765 [Sphingobacteriales bacterium]|nr:MAG: hypothetical protein EAZ64_09175 [Sphingobacteriales bacterium]TAF80048.1 MAG: hypothetical protein EAZ51_06765 [Sphingobacteriales bacterium]